MFSLTKLILFCKYKADNSANYCNYCNRGNKLAALK